MLKDMGSPDLTAILAELAAGRIDAKEASRRIETAKLQAAEANEGPLDVVGDRAGEEVVADHPGDGAATDSAGVDADSAAASADGPSGSDAPRPDPDSTRRVSESHRREVFDRHPDVGESSEPDASGPGAAGPGTSGATTGPDATGPDAPSSGATGHGSSGPGAANHGRPGGESFSSWARGRRDWIGGASGGTGRFPGAGHLREGAESLRNLGKNARETFNRDFLGMEDREPPHDPGAAEDHTVPGPRPVKGVERVAIRSVGHRIRVIADPRTSTVQVDGEHVLRRTGTVIEIATESTGRPFEGFSVLRPPRSLGDVRDLGLGKQTVIRVNPDLIVDAEVTGGGFTTEDVPWLGRVRVTAGGATLTGVEMVEDALIQAGWGQISGTITTGRSRIRCESGNMNIHLGDDSNVTVHSESQVGRVVWAGGHTGAGDEVAMGNGSARLDVGAVMGRAVVHIGTAVSE